eukprot:4779840-Heterocapsa_arctica.AAC.1
MPVSPMPSFMYTDMMAKPPRSRPSTCTATNLPPCPNSCLFLKGLVGMQLRAPTATPAEVSRIPGPVLTAALKSSSRLALLAQALALPN